MLFSRLLFHPVQRIVPLRTQVFSLFSTHRMSVLSSEYHKLGPVEFKISRSLQKQLGNNLNAIQKIQMQLENQRKTLLQSQKKLATKARLPKNELEAYLDVHTQLVKAVQKCQLNNEYVFKLIGWYNMTSFYHTLFSRLLNAGSSEVKLLIEAMSIMKYHETASPTKIQDEIDSQQFQKLYKTLPLDIEHDQLQKLEKMFNSPLNFPKKKYYSHYIQGNIEDILRRARGEDQNSISDVIWMFYIYSMNMLNNELIVSKIEKCLTMLNNVQLKKEDMERIIDIYTHQGQINKKFYQSIVKPYLVANYIDNNFMKDIDSLVRCVKFLVCSECEDYKFVQEVFKNIAKVYIPHMKISQSTSETLHILYHYISIKYKAIHLPLKLQTHVVNTCVSAAKTNPSVNKLVYKEEQAKDKSNRPKKVNNAVQCLIGKCLQAQECSQAERQQFSSLYQKQIISQIDFSSMKLYKNVRFCHIQMSYFLCNPTQFINLQTEGINYIFSSGRYLRWKQVKDDILNHYGIRTIYLHPESYIQKGRVSDEEYLMQHRVSKVK